MHLRFLACLAAIPILAFAACAKNANEGSTVTSSVGSGGAGSMSASSSSKGSSGGKGGSGPGGAASSTVSASTGPCSESPCKLTSPQCGCAGDQACQVDGTGARECVTAGQAGTNAACDPTSKPCKAGDACIGTKGAPTSCYAYCESDSDCSGPGSLCIINLDDMNGQPIMGVQLCSTNCDPITNLECVSGARCSIGQETTGQMRDYTTCLAAGMGAAGDTCTDDTQCKAGFICLPVDTTSQCFQLCDVANPTTCLMGQACQPIPGQNGMTLAIGGTQYGACG